MITFLQYLKYPIYTRDKRIDWSLFLRLFLFYFIILIPISLLSKLSLKLLNLQESEFDLGILKLVFAGLILAPFIEEMIFRLILKPNLKNIFWLCCFTSIMMVFFLMKFNLVYFVIFLSFSLLSFLLFFNKVLLKKVQIFTIRHFNYIFYFNCISFGYYHISNYSIINFKLILFSPLIVLPQVFGGFFLGFIRIRFGIIYSILFHSLINIFPILFLIWS